jgi:predicted transcriptional regulator
MGQGVLSRLEHRADIQFSTLRQYVEALGASLCIDAELGGGKSLNIFKTLNSSKYSDKQLLLPEILDSEPVRDIVLSIKPQYSSMIMKGRKTVELRRRFPEKLPTGTLAIIYSTTPEQAIIGTASIKSVHKKPISSIWSQYSKKACIGKNEFDNYFAGLDEGYVLQFENVCSLDRALSLSELRQRFSFKPPQSFFYAKLCFREALAALIHHGGETGWRA